jgi:hypothetical protein
MYAIEYLLRNEFLFLSGETSHHKWSSVVTLTSSASLMLGHNISLFLPSAE